jgi:hypothetical protein
MDKATILKQLETLSTDKLNKLLNYANLMLLPDASTLLNVNQPTLVNKAMELADIYFPEWTDRSESDFGRFLIEIMALFSEKDFAYINHYANESFLLRTQFYSNAYYKAMELGYVPENVFLPTFEVSESVFSEGSFLQVPKGSLRLELTVFSGNDPFAGVVYKKFTVTNAIAFDVPTSTQNATIDNVLFIHGTFLTKSTPFEGRAIKIFEKNCDLKTLVVKVNNQVYTKTASFSGLNSTSLMYIAVPDNEGSFVLHFGDGDLGYLPDFGSTVDIEVFHNNDFNEVNLLQSELSLPHKISVKLLSNLTRGLISLTNSSTIKVDNTSYGNYADFYIESAAPYANSRGVLQPSLGELKSKACLWYNNSKRIINETDAYNFLKTFGGFTKVSTSILGNYLNISVLKTGMTSTQINTYINAEVKPNVLQGIQVVYTPATLVNLTDTVIEVYVTKGFNLRNSALSVFNAFRAFTNPDGLAEFGTPFNSSAFTTYCISTIAGINNVVVRTVNGDAPTISNKGLFPSVLSKSEILTPPNNNATATETVTTNGFIYVKDYVTLNVF